MITNRLTQKFNLTSPIIQAPMALAAGGALAAAVSRQGALGLIGGGYGDKDWLEQQFDLTDGQSVGCGFITWSLKSKPHLLDIVLDRKPSAIFLSFGDPEPFASTIKNAGVPLICQIQSIKDAKRAIEVGADVIVAQGSEAGGHGESRGTMTLVPEVADLIDSMSSDTLLCAAGGIADGRGLAASLMLGADGVLIGSRFWATEEALVHPHMLNAAIQSTGDGTIRSSVMDIARRLKWPSRYTARVLKNGFTEKWHYNLAGLLQNQDAEADLWKQAWAAGDINVANTFVGEAAGLINDIKPAAKVLEDITIQAEKILAKQL